MVEELDIRSLLGLRFVDCWQDDTMNYIELDDGRVLVFLGLGVFQAERNVH